MLSGKHTEAHEVNNANASSFTACLQATRPAWEQRLPSALLNWDRRPARHPRSPQPAPTAGPVPTGRVPGKHCRLRAAVVPQAGTALGRPRGLVCSPPLFWSPNRPPWTHFHHRYAPPPEPKCLSVSSRPGCGSRASGLREQTQV